VLIGIVILLVCLGMKGRAEPFSEADKNYAAEAMSQLNQFVKEKKTIQAISDMELQAAQHRGHIHIIGKPDEDDENEDGKEHMTFFHPINNRYWPYYFYSFPYFYDKTGSWPPNMYSRLYNLQPAFNTSGWSYWMRPGVAYSAWPRGRWVKHNQNHYFINNGHDRMKDYYGSAA